MRVLAVSGVSGEGLEELREALWGAVARARAEGDETLEPEQPGEEEEELQW
jgi:ABC-type uncharacterized transport system ATPase subunit